jgi:hypothetical protein
MQRTLPDFTASCSVLAPVVFEFSKRFPEMKVDLV